MFARKQLKKIKGTIAQLENQGVLNYFLVQPSIFTCQTHQASKVMGATLIIEILKIYNLSQCTKNKNHIKDTWGALC